MFRKGGSANEGITSGLRPWYPCLGARPEVIPSPALPPFLNIGLRIILFIIKYFL